MGDVCACVRGCHVPQRRVSVGTRAYMGLFCRGVGLDTSYCIMGENGDFFLFRWGMRLVILGAFLDMKG